MIDPFFEDKEPLQFGRRQAVPRVTIVDGKPHIRSFLGQAFEGLGFVVQECARAADVSAVLSAAPANLVVSGLLSPKSDVADVLSLLASKRYAGKVMLFGGRASTELQTLHELGEGLGLAMLPPLLTPYRDSDLCKNLSDFLPIRPAPSVPVDVEQAMHNGWLELWYQPKVDLRRMTLCGVEALIRMRHPNWGVVSPSSFLPADIDPQMRALSEFVVGRAMDDWSYFTQGRSPVEMTIHLPTSVLEDSRFIDRMCLRLPDHSAYARLIVEVNSRDVGRDPGAARKAAKQLGVYNVGVSIDDVTEEASWADIGDFPIAELQVDRNFIDGCADDRRKRAVCGRVLEIAERLSARANAKGIETAADFQAVCDMGFVFGQGFLFAKPMEKHAFARTMLRGRQASRT